jgi:hypothetical protein
MAAKVLQNLDSFMYVVEQIREEDILKIIEDEFAIFGKRRNTINYGVAQRAIDAMGKNERQKIASMVKQKLENATEQNLTEEQLKEELRDFKKTEEKIKAEVKKIGEQLIRDKKRSEESNEITVIVMVGIVGGIYTALLNAIIDFVQGHFQEGLSNIAINFLVGVIFNVIIRTMLLVFYEVKKRVYNDPYAQISFGEYLFYSAVFIAASASAIFIALGHLKYGIGSFVLLVLINVILNVAITLVARFFGAFGKVNKFFKDHIYLFQSQIEDPKLRSLEDIDDLTKGFQRKPNNPNNSETNNQEDSKFNKPSMA